MWKRRRRIAAAAQATAFLGLPFLSIRGESALRFDIPGMKLHLLGTVVWVDEFRVVLLGSLFLALLALGATVVCGRVWCGWLCGQTVLPELASMPSSLLPERWRKAGIKLFLLPLTALVSLSLLWYFVPPAEVSRDLFRSPALSGFFMAQWAVLYFLVTILGARFCRTICPYAMLQNVLFDNDTLVVAFDAARRPCLECGHCVKGCPAGIDIKDGLQRECLACAGCIDACRGTTMPRGLAPFVAYRGRVLRGKTLLFGGATAMLGIVFFLSVHQRPDVLLSIQWDGKPPGYGLNAYRYTVRNRLPEPLSLALGVENGAEILGNRDVRVGPLARYTGKAIVRSGKAAGDHVTFVLSGPGVSIREKAVFP